VKVDLCVCCSISAKTIAVNIGCELARYSCTNSQKSCEKSTISIAVGRWPVVWPMVTITVSSYKIGENLLTAEGKP
jgi:hypothetical protein